jgi:hypothetical protein
MNKPPESKTMKWSFQNNETEILLSTGRLLKIKTLNETTLELTSEEIGFPDKPKNITILKH